MNGNTSIADDIRAIFKRNDIIIQLILINILIYVGLNAFRLVAWLAGMDGVFGTLLSFFAAPAALTKLIFRPWTVISYMFTHIDLFHILFNMLWLYWIGSILKDMVGPKKIVPIYLFGGLAGVGLYLIAYNLLPAFSGDVAYAQVIGASAGVYAVVFAAATVVPNYPIRLILIGAVPLKYLAFVPLLIDALSIPNGNAGGKIAHIGGAAFGFIFIKMLQNGTDLSKGINGLLDSIGTSLKSTRKGPKVAYRNNNPQKKASANDPITQKKIDTILDKISEKGYNNLSAEEKDILFKYSNKR